MTFCYNYSLKNISVVFCFVKKLRVLEDPTCVCDFLHKPVFSKHFFYCALKFSSVQILALSKKWLLEQIIILV